jgi:hypothetical protein
MSECDLQAQLTAPLKAVGAYHYVHLDGFHLLAADATARLVAAESLAQITRGDRFNSARFDKDDQSFQHDDFRPGTECSRPAGQCKPARPSRWHKPASIQTCGGHPDR